MDTPNKVDREKTIQWLKDSGLTPEECEESFTMFLLNTPVSELSALGLLKNS